MTMCNLYTDQTTILELTHQVHTDDLFFSKINIDLDTFEIHPNWYIKEKQFYYFKVLNNMEILNHFICEYIAPIFGLASAHFVPAESSQVYGLASENFRKSGVSYCYPSSFDIWQIGNLFSPIQLKFYEDTENILVSDLLRVVAFQIYTEWDDLHLENLMFQKESNGFRLAPLFDYDYAFESKHCIKEYDYRSFICQFSMPSDGFDVLLNQYPIFKKLLHLFLEIDMDRILNTIVSEWHLMVNDWYLEHYKKQDEIKKDFVRSLHL